MFFLQEIQKDMPEAINAIGEVHKQALDINQSIKTLGKRVKDGNFQSSKVIIIIIFMPYLNTKTVRNFIKYLQGLSFLEVKNHMLLSYITNLTYLMYQKLNGKKIEFDSSIDRLVETRTVLEKMRPIDQKLKYQIDKLLTSATTGNIS